MPINIEDPGHRKVAGWSAESRITRPGGDPGSGGLWQGLRKEGKK